MLTYTLPDAAADALSWRHRILSAARERAVQLRLEGASFPWRTVAGEECSAYWPAGTAAFHVNADIADAVTRYMATAGGDDWAEQYAVELLVETARLWASLGYFDDEGAFRIDGVTGPDEYSALADNNIYTNLMARRNLLAAADMVERYEGHDVEPHEVETWRRAAEVMMIPYDHRLGVHPQSEGFTDHQRWDFEGTTADEYPLMLHFPYVELYRRQVVKQADLVLALYLCGNEFTPAQKAADFAYYEGLTVRDSSLSAGVQAIVAAETGHLELAFAYLLQAALMDVDDLERNTRDGLHIASLAGAWLAVVAGFGGMRDHSGQLCFAPRLPPQLTRVAFSLGWRKARIHVEVTPGEVAYEVHGEGEVTFSHLGEQITLADGGREVRPLEPVEQPHPAPVVPGREPSRPGQ